VLGCELHGGSQSGWGVGNKRVKLRYSVGGIKVLKGGMFQGRIS
jgi:hypothetical protein